jgi:hypothetical protein
MATINQLKNRESQRKVLAVSFGLQAVVGHLAYSYYNGTQVVGYNALGEGEWDACEQAYYKGIQIPTTDFNFHTGAIATAMNSGAQQVDPLFSADVPHSRTAAIGYKVPVGIADVDTETNPPNDFKGIFRTKKTPDFNSSGTQTGFSYSPNPGRCIVELLNTYARLPNLPSSYASMAAYWISRIDWANWVDFRDYHAGTETVDYTTIADFQGFGLTATFFSDTTLTTQVRKFVQPTIDSQGTMTAPPVYGVSPTSFSARFEGKIKPKYTETYTFRVTHDDGAKLWVNGTLIIDQWGTTGTHTGTIALTAGTFYDIKLEGFNGSGSWDFRLEWNSTSQPYETVPEKYLYPKPESRPRYESHVFWDTPTNLADGIKQILLVSNSIMQDVNGKLRFYCLEQLTPTFDLTQDMIDDIKFKRRDLLQVDPITSYEATMKDLDSNYLEEPISPVRIEIDHLTRTTAEKVRLVELFNTTRWQARKVLQTRAMLEIGNGLFTDITCKNAKSYPIIAGDVGTVTHTKLGHDPITVLVREATDKAVSETGRQQGKEIEQRVFTTQEWS